MTRALSAMLAMILATACDASETRAQRAVEIEEWEVPWASSRPRDPYVAPSGNVWFVGQRADYAARLEPATGEFRRYNLDPGAGPHNLIVATDGQVWYAGNRMAHIGRLDPANGSIDRVEMPAGVQDPHTLVFAPDGAIWFTAQGSNFVGRLDPATREVHVIPVSTPGARPYGIVVDPAGRPWIALFGTNKLATVDPATRALTEIALPAEDARPRRLGVTSDGLVYYVDYARGTLGSYDPAAGAFEERSLPGGPESRPYGMAIDDQDRVWVVETGMNPNRVVPFDARTGAFGSVTPVPSGGGTIRHMSFDPATGSVWFGTDANTIGRFDTREAKP